MGAEPSPDSGNSFTASAHLSVAPHQGAATGFTWLIKIPEVFSLSETSPPWNAEGPQIPMGSPTFPLGLSLSEEPLGTSILCGAVVAPADSREKLFSDSKDSLSPSTDFKAALKLPTKCWISPIPALMAEER